MDGSDADPELVKICAQSRRNLRHRVRSVSYGTTMVSPGMMLTDDNGQNDW